MAIKKRMSRAGNGCEREHDDASSWSPHFCKNKSAKVRHPAECALLRVEKHSMQNKIAATLSPQKLSFRSV